MRGVAQELAPLGEGALMWADHRTDFARNLRRLMSQRGLNAKSLLWAMEDEGGTQKVLAWLNGERMPSAESLYALKSALRCTWEELMDGC